MTTRERFQVYRLVSDPQNPNNKKRVIVKTLYNDKKAQEYCNSNKCDGILEPDFLRFVFSVPKK